MFHSTIRSNITILYMSNNCHKIHINHVPKLGEIKVHKLHANLAYPCHSTADVVLSQQKQTHRFTSLLQLFFCCIFFLDVRLVLNLMCELKPLLKSNWWRPTSVFQFTFRSLQFPTQYLVSTYKHISIYCTNIQP